MFSSLGIAEGLTDNLMVLTPERTKDENGEKDKRVRGGTNDRNKTDSKKEQKDIAGARRERENERTCKK